MTYSQISGMASINNTDMNKVVALADSMRDHGFVGCPILIVNDQLLTGSHRIAALQLLEDEGVDISDWEVAEDVTDLVNEALEKFEEENGWSRDMDCSDIGWIFKGTWIEEYRDEIKEW